jgi:antitoxin component of MazEF toxin-antitoxin module
MRLRTQIIPIGDSLGVCLPQPAIERSGLSRDVELEVRRNEIVIHSCSPPEATEAPSRDDEIGSLYSEIRDLLERSDRENGLGEEIQSRYRRLRQLQTQEADAVQARFEAGRNLKPGRGWEALRKAHEILANETPAAVDKAPDSKDPKTP